MKKITFLGVLILFFINASGQVGIKNLLFNSYENVVRMDFATSPPSIINMGIPGSSSNVAEGIAHIEDASGNIIFWFSSCGVYDKNGTLMPGSVGIIANPSSSEINVCAFPNEPQKYYLLYNAETCSPLYYSVVDLSLRSGLGDVTNLNTLLDGSNFAEGMELIRIPCTNKLWYLVYNCTNGFTKFLIDENGIQPGQVIHPYPIPEGFDGRGELDYHKGKIGMAYAWSNVVFTSDFDPLNGMILNPKTISIPISTYQTGAYGLEFSPDASKMYFSLWYTNMYLANNNLYQYEYSTGNLNSYSIANNLGEIEMGKDGKLYVINDESNEISCINNPNDNNITITQIQVTPKLSLGISDFIQSDIYNEFDVQVSDSCIVAGNSSILTASGGTNYSWSPSNSLSQSTGPIVIASPTVTTIYTLNSSDSIGCAGSATVKINVISASCMVMPNPSIINTPVNFNYMGTSNSDDSIVWDLGNGNLAYGTTASCTYDAEGTYKITMTVISKSYPNCKADCKVDLVIIKPSSVEIPNVFTPNNDNKNDFFKTKNSGLTNEHMEIYNRWGEKVYEWNDIGGSWNGLVNKGQKAAEGTYFYIYHAAGIDQKQYNFNGEITLIR